MAAIRPEGRVRPVLARPAWASRYPAAGRSWRRGFVAAAALAGGLMAAAVPDPAPAATPTVHLVPVVGNLANPVLVVSPPDGSNRLFVVEQGGLVKIVRPGASPTVFLDLRAQVFTGAQQGLVGFAFHPDYAVNRRFFVDYTRRPDTATVVAEYRASADDPDTADTEETVLIEIHEPLPNLAGGTLAFGPDRLLYIGVGNAGVADDPRNTAQDLNQLLGKILRIDVDRPADGRPYSSPADNPFAGDGFGRDEIFAYGLRNPWRFSFDRLTGDLLAGDVGNTLREEVNLITRGGNFGWRVREGFACADEVSGLCGSPSFIPPLVDYPHAGGRCAVVGGHVYRGARGTLPAGTYIFGDFCSGEIFVLNGGTMERLLDTALVITSFGEDQDGELYVIDWLGGVYRLARIAGAEPGIASAVLPTTRSVPVGDTATAFATMIWTGTEPAIGCGIASLRSVPPGEFLYQTTDPATNALTGTPNTPVSLAPGASQTFLVAFTPAASAAPRDLLLAFSCANAPPAPVIAGLNTLLVSASSQPVPDVLAIASTASGDGIVRPSAGGAPAAFAVAVVNAGAPGTIKAAADTGAAALGVDLAICATVPETGTCIAPPAPTSTVDLAPGASATFTVTVTAPHPIAFDPAYHRVSVRFTDAAGVTRGQTSVAVRAD